MANPGRIGTISGVEGAKIVTVETDKDHSLSDGGCVPDDQIELIMSPAYTAANLPTPQNVEPTFYKVATAFRNLGNAALNAKDYYLGRRLYIFMSGHGIVPTRSAIPDFDEAA